MVETLIVAAEQVEAVQPEGPGITEVVGDKGYHSNRTMTDLKALGLRSYIWEPDRGRRCWKGRPKARDAVYGNRRRIRGARGRRLLRCRGELLERPFAHVCETGGMRRVHLRGHPNILKRLLVQVAGCNLGLLLRQLMGVGTPRNLQGRAAVVFSALSLETHEAVFTLRAAGSAAPMPSATLNSRYSRATPHASAPRIHPCSFDPMACLLRHQRGEDGDHVGAADLVRCRSRIEPQYRSRARRRSSGPWPFEAAAASTRSHAVRKVGTRDG